MRTNDLVTVDKLNEEIKILNENIKKATLPNVTVTLAMQHIYGKVKQLNDYLEKGTI